MSANIKASTDGTKAIIGVGGVDQMTVSNAGVVTANSFVGSISAGNISTSTAIATGSTTARTLANRFADVVNVKDFGAVGDGVADDTAAIQTALNSGRGIYFPIGNYISSFGVRIRTKTPSITERDGVCTRSQTFGIWRDDRNGVRNTAKPRQTLRTG